MSIFITGSESFIGRVLLDQCAALAISAVGIDATAKPSLKKFAAKPKVPAEVMERINLEDFVGGNGD